MNEQDLVDFITALEGVEMLVASEELGSSEGTWGDMFFSTGEGAFPFVTIVTQDLAGVDESCRLDRDGVFRVNIGIGRDRMKERFGREMTSDRDPSDFDHLFPNPLYAAHGWISVLNPDTTADEVCELIRAAHQRAGAG